MPRARALLRQWGGIMDMSMDGSPIIDKTPVDGLYLNAAGAMAASRRRRRRAGASRT
jgi:glycine/D-amino acid oxidase-like deaminating enzyme